MTNRSANFNNLTSGNVTLGNGVLGQQVNFSCASGYTFATGDTCKKKNIEEIFFGGLKIIYFFFFLDSAISICVAYNQTFGMWSPNIPTCVAAVAIQSSQSFIQKNEIYIGIAIVVVVLAVILLIVICVCVSRRSKKRKLNNAEELNVIEVGKTTSTTTSTTTAATATPEKNVEEPAKPKATLTPGKETPYTAISNPSVVVGTPTNTNAHYTKSPPPSETNSQPPNSDHYARSPAPHDSMNVPPQSRSSSRPTQLGIVILISHSVGIVFRLLPFVFD